MLSADRFNPLAKNRLQLPDLKVCLAIFSKGVTSDVFFLDEGVCFSIV
jgi:hypothetical protein